MSLSKNIPFANDFSRLKGREKEISDFRTLLKDEADNEPLPLLMYHGAAGVGKSWLFNYFQQEICDAWSVPWIALNLAASAKQGATEAEITDAADAAALMVEQFTEKYKAIFREYEPLGKALQETGPALHPGIDKAWQIVKNSPYALATYLALYDSGLSSVLSNHAALVSAVTFMATSLNVILQGNPLYERLRYGSHGQSEVLALKNMDAATLHKQHLPRFVAGLKKLEGFAEEYKQHAERRVKAILFFDNFEFAMWKAAADCSAEEWLNQLYQAVKNDGILLVVAGRTPLIFPDEENSIWQTEDVPVRQDLLRGLQKSDAEEFLREDIPGIPKALIVEALALARESQRESTHYHPATLKFCALIIKNELQGDKYPEKLSLDEGIEGSLPLRKQLANRFLISLHDRGLEHWLPVLALLPYFDENLVEKLDAETINWHAVGARPRPKSDLRSNLSRLDGQSILVRYHDVSFQKKNVKFYEIHSVLRQALREQVSQSDSEYLHSWAYDYWVDRASSEVSEKGMRVMEQAFWHDMTNSSLYHQRELGQSGDQSAIFTTLRVLLDWYWWWGENLSHELWPKLLDGAAVAIASNQNADPGRTYPNQIIESLRHFDKVWPKNWERDTADWKDVLNTVLTIQELCEKLAGSKSRGLGPKRVDTYSHVKAMIAYYIGCAHRYVANLSADKDKGFHFAEAEKAFIHYQEWFKKDQKGKGKLKWAWAQVSLAELYSDCARPKDAERAARVALKRLGREKGNTEEDSDGGAYMEGAGDAHLVLSAVALKDNRWLAAGREMGCALVYGLGFCATDQDDYAATYYRRLRSEAEKQFRPLLEQPQRARAYLQGLRHKWGSSPDTGNWKSEDFLSTFQDTCLDDMPRKANEKPAWYAEKKEWFKERYDCLVTEGEPE